MNHGGSAKTMQEPRAAQRGGRFHATELFDRCMHLRYSTPRLLAPIWHLICHLTARRRERSECLVRRQKDESRGFDESSSCRKLARVLRYIFPSHGNAFKLLQPTFYHFTDPQERQLNPRIELSLFRTKPHVNLPLALGQKIKLNNVKAASSAYVVAN